EKTNKAKTLKLRRLRKVRTSQRVDTFDDTLMEDGRHADIYHIDMDHAAKVLSMQKDESKVQEAVEVVTTAKLITEVVAAVSETVSAAAVISSPVLETISAADIPTITTPSIKVAAPVKATVWKFLIHTILQSMSAKSTSWNEFSLAMASVVICLSTGRKFNFSKYIFVSLVRNVDSSTKFYMYPRFINLIIQNQLGDLSTHSIKYISPALTQKVFANIKRVGKGCSGVETSLFEGMLVAREPKEQGDVEEQSNEEEHGDVEEQSNEEEQGNANTTAKVSETAVPEDVANDQPIPSPTPLTPPPQQPQDVPSTSHAKSPPLQPHSPTPSQTQGAHFPMSLLQEALDACAALARRVEHLEQDKVAQDLEIIKLNTRVKKLEKANKAKTLKLRRLRKVGRSQRVDTSDDTIMEDDDIYNIDMDHAAKVLSMQEEESEVQEAVEVVTTAKLITKVVAAVSETGNAAAVILSAVLEIISAAAAVPTIIAPPVKDKGKGIMVEEPKPIKKKQQVELDEAYARKLQEEINQDIDWEVAMDHVKQKAKDEPFIQRYQMEEEESRAIALINQTPAQKAAKRRKLIEEAKEAESIKQHLQIVPDEHDDVFTEATPLARKFPVVDYQVILVNNKPRYKIIKADDTH
nr:hypothetical protein [Tanacetum cinerariifolium]